MTHLGYDVEPKGPPLVAARAQLDVLARQLLAQRSGLEAIIEAAGGNKAVASMAHALVDQLGAAFAVVNVLQMTADISDAGETVQIQSDEGTVKKPPVFGAKRRAAEAAAGSHSATEDMTDGKRQGERAAAAEGARAETSEADGRHGAGIRPPDRG